MTKPIPVNKPLLGDKERTYLKQCIDTEWISSEGPFVREFENKFSAYIGLKHGIAVSNGSAALDVAFAAIDIKPGDEVIMPTFTIISCINPIVRMGAKPVLIDSDRESYNMSVDQIEEKITEKTKAILVVHIYGLACDMDPIIKLAKKYKLLIIEDCAEAIGQSYKNSICGSFGDISIFSFYPNKHITTGEGGMIVTDDDELANRSRYFMNLCFSETRFIHHHMGWNYRMTNLQAAIGLAQLEKIQSHLRLKRRMGEFYNSAFSEFEFLQLPLVSDGNSSNLYWVYPITLKENSPVDRANVLEFLSKSKIGTRTFFWPMHEQPVFKKMRLFTNEKYPVAEYISRNGFYIPSGLGNDKEDQKIVAERLRGFFHDCI